MEKGLVGILKSLEKNLEKITEKNGKRVRYIKEINELIPMFTDLKITEEFSVKYNELLKMGSELNEGDNFRNIKKMERFLPECFYLYYSLKGEIDTIMKKLMYSFFVTAILFVLAAFPLFPMWVTLIFIAPMYIGVRGLAKRSGKGITIGRVLVEFSTFTGFIALVFIIAAIPKFNEFLDGLITHYKSVGDGITRGSMTICVILYAFIAIGLIAVSLYNSYYIRRYKKLFL